MNDQVQKFYTDFDFEKMVTGNPPLLIREFLEKEIKFLRKNIPAGKTVLEIGCGYGRLLHVLASRAKKVVGIDFSRPLIQKAKYFLGEKCIKNADIYFMHADKLKFTKNMFDFTLCLDATFGNMPGIELAVLKEMKRVTKRDGKIVLSVFSESAKAAQIENYRRIGLTGIHDNGSSVLTNEGLYSRRFTKEELKNLCSDAGLKCKIRKLCGINYIAIGEKI